MPKPNVFFKHSILTQESVIFGDAIPKFFRQQTEDLST